MTLCVHATVVKLVIALLTGARLSSGLGTALHVVDLELGGGAG